MLLVKSTLEDGRAASEKKEIMSKIKTPVEEVKETKDGHVLIRFEDRNKLKKAKSEFELGHHHDNNIIANKKKINISRR